MRRGVLHDMPGKFQHRNAKALDKDIQAIARLMYPDYDFSLYERAFADVVRLHRGQYPGFRAANAKYHDLGHTLSTTLACARLMHGIHLERLGLGRLHMTVGLLAALFHDTGYVQTVDDTEGTGARHTDVHVERSVDFMRAYLTVLGLGERFIRDVESAIRCTDLSRPLGEISFSCLEIRLTGCALGSADIIAQMSDDTYVEKLLRLYQEFREAGNARYRSEYDLFRDTPAFHAAMRERMAGELGNVAHLVRGHFRARWDVDEDLYERAIEKNLKYLNTILQQKSEDYRAMLRRSTRLSPVFA